MNNTDIRTYAPAELEAVEARLAFRMTARLTTAESEVRLLSVSEAAQYLYGRSDHATLWSPSSGPVGVLSVQARDRSAWGGRSASA